MPQYTDEDTWSVSSGYEDVNAIPETFHFVAFLMLAPVKLAVADIVSTKQEYETQLLRILNTEFNNQVSEYCLAISTNSTKEWYTTRLELLQKYPGLCTEQGWLSGKHNELSAILINTLREQFGVDKLESILENIYSIFASQAPNSNEVVPLRTAEFGFQFNENNVWYPTEMMKALIKTLPMYYGKLVLKKASLYTRPTSEIIEIINAAPDHITEINISDGSYREGSKEQLLSILSGLRKSKLILKLKPEDFGIGNLSEYALNAAMRVMPPRAYLRIKNMPVDCCLQSKARALLHKTLSLIETETFKIPDAALSELLNDQIRLLHMVDIPESEFIVHLAARKLMHEVQSIIDMNEYVFDNIAIPNDAETSDVGLQQFIYTLESYKTPLSYFCCALLLSVEINCYWDTSKPDLDNEEYIIKRFTDAINFYKLAFSDVSLQPICRHLLSRIKYDLKVQESNGADRFKNFLQHVFEICNSLDTAPVLAWRHTVSCKDYAKELVICNPAITLSTGIEVLEEKSLKERRFTLRVM